MSHQFKLLIIDDERDIVEFLSDQLNAQGYAILTASDGQQGLQLIDAERPDLILLNVVMRGMGGYERDHDTDGKSEIASPHPSG